MAIIPVKSPFTLIIISSGAPLVLVAVASHGGCCKIFGIWNNRILSNPFWKFICGILGWVLTRSVSLRPTVFLDISLFAKFVTINIWLGRWPYYRATTIYTAATLEINLIKILVDRILNRHSLLLCKWRLVLRIFFAGSRLPLLWIHKIAIF